MMKKKILILVGIILIIVSFSLFLLLKNRLFYLDDEYYEDNSLVEITSEDFDKLILDGKSFGIFVYESMCKTAVSLNEVILDYQEENKVMFYKISFSEIKNSNYVKFLKYYPSFIIYNKGRKVDFLEADSNKDTNKYRNLDDFSKWLESYVKLK